MAAKFKLAVCRNPKCKKEFRQFNSLERFCSPQCIEATLPKLVRRGQLERKRKEREEMKALRAKREKLKTIGKLLQEAQREYNKYIRERDFALGCISCHMPPSYVGQWQAGHYRTTAAAPQLRFNDDNVHKQCSQCNGPKSGNIVEYRIGLVERIGAERVAALEMDNRSVKWDREEVAALRREYVGKWRALKAAREARCAA